jgi:hypothetical protein
MAPEFFEVPGTSAQQGIEAIPQFPRPIVPSHAGVVLGMPAHRLNRRAPVESLAHLGGEIPATCAIDCDRPGMIALAAKALIDKRFLGLAPR